MAGATMTEPVQFLTNKDGEKIAVVITVDEYAKILEQLEELEDIRAYDEAKASGEAPIPLKQALDAIERKGK